MSERDHRTERAAHRLIKSQARKHVYQAKARETDGSAYEKMLMLEEAIEEEATKDWADVLSLWPQGFGRLALPSLIGKAASQAYEECRPFGEELGEAAEKALTTFFDSEFEPEILLFQCTSSQERPS